MAMTHHPNLIRAQAESQTAWLNDLTHLFNNRRDLYPDVKFFFDRRSASRDAIWAHRAMIRARNMMLYTQTNLADNSPDGILVRPVDQSIRRMLMRWLETSYTSVTRNADDASSIVSSVSVGAGDRRIDELRRNLDTMWIQKYHPDLQLTLVAPNASNHRSWSLRVTCTFDCHRFIIASRAPPQSRLQSLFLESVADESDRSPVLRLSTEHFTSSSLEMTVRYIYTGGFGADDDDIDLETALWTMRSATYLGLGMLHETVEAYIVEIMMHGLFDAYSIEEPDSPGSRGCECATCRERICKVIHFAQVERNDVLMRGSIRALVHYFGRFWISREFAQLPSSVLTRLGDAVQDEVSPQNAVRMVHACDQTLSACTEPWAAPIGNIVQRVSTTTHTVLSSDCWACLSQDDWIDLLRHDRYGGEEDLLRVERILHILERRIEFGNAVDVLQAITSSFSRCPRPSASTSRAHLPPKFVALQNARERVKGWIRLNWRTVRDHGGFASMDASVARELAQEIGVNETQLLRMPDRDSDSSVADISQAASLLRLYNPATTPIREDMPTPRRTGSRRSSLLRPFESDLHLPLSAAAVSSSRRNQSMDEGRRPWLATQDMEEQYESRFREHATQRAVSPPIPTTPMATPTSPMSAILSPFRRLGSVRLRRANSDAQPTDGTRVRSRSLSSLLLPRFARLPAWPSRDSTSARPDTITPENAQQMLCTVCTDRQREVLFKDCKHFYVCQSCCDRIMTTDQRCPGCRKRIVEPPVRIYT